MIKAIMACDRNGGIGNNGTLPWPHFSEDFAHFKRETIGYCVVMGSTTWKDPDMPKPMPRRINVVVSRNPTEDMYAKAHHVIRGQDIAEQIVRLHDELNSGAGVDVFIIGGRGLVEQCWNIIEEWWLTLIPGTYECDTHLDLDRIHSEWKLIDSWNDDAEQGLEFQRFTRKEQ
jgi:dihydrofolate reductase